MREFVTLFVFLILGFLGSRGYVSRVTRRSLFWGGFFVTGVEFFVVGVLAGPQVSGLISAPVLDSLEPLIALGLGWIGALFGVELAIPALRRLSKSLFTFLVLDGVVVLVVVATACWCVMHFGLGLPARSELVAASLVMGVAAGFVSPGVVSLVAKRTRSRGSFTGSVKLVSALSALVPIVLLGVASVVDSNIESGWAMGFAWWVFLNASAIVFGFLAVLFTRERCSDDEMGLVLLGTVLLVGGLNHFLGLSSLYTGVIMGAVVANFSPRHQQVFRELHQLEHTVFFALLVLTGASLTVSTRPLLLMLLVYTGARFLVRASVTTPLFRRYFAHSDPPGVAGWSLMSQGGMAIAAALDFAIGGRGAAGDLVVAVVAVGAIVGDLSGLLFVRRALAASGDTAVSKQT